MTILLRAVQVDGACVDVRLDGPLVAQVGDLAAQASDEVVDGRGGALIPGLHDHHLHLLALAAVDRSIDVRTGLDALANQEGTGWVRGVGLARDADRRTIDAVVADRPVRLQHRSGALWVVNSAGVRALGLSEVELPGVERDEAGEPTGRLWRLDAWLAKRIGRSVPELASLGVGLARFGITGCTDATPDLDRETCALLRSVLPQRLLLLGDPDGRGPVKIVLPDHDLPAYAEVLARVRAVRPRPVAVHCVTREAIVLFLAALDEAGRVGGDRVEHAALAPPELVADLPPVVTQPGFLLDRGDDYLHQVDPGDLPDLYRYQSLLNAGTPVVPSSDAPFGPLDPWVVLRSARDRRTRSGKVVNATEAVSVAQALDGMLRPLDDLTAPARRVRPGADADLVLLHVPLAAALDAPASALVRQTWIGGRPLL